MESIISTQNYFPCMELGIIADLKKYRLMLISFSQSMRATFHLMTGKGPMIKSYLHLPSNYRHGISKIPKGYKGSSYRVFVLNILNNNDDG
ncbi:hypothetical protein BKM16_26590 [Pseudomonas amygdali pv. morsprunorum]|nr:hypothetical protein BKM16_26590 [Pseudomonas amygdali pv. morsprunorum]